MEFKTCGNCFVHLPINEFGKKRNLEIYKHCGNCRLIKKRSYSNNKEKRVCPHNHEKRQREVPRFYKDGGFWDFSKRRSAKCSTAIFK